MRWLNGNIVRSVVVASKIYYLHGGFMNQSDIDVVLKMLTTIWSELLSFGVVLAGFYAIWVLVSAILRFFKV